MENRFPSKKKGLPLAEKGLSGKGSYQSTERKPPAQKEISKRSFGRSPEEGTEILQGVGRGKERPAARREGQRTGRERILLGQRVIHQNS